MRLISGIKLWDSVATQLGSDSKAVKAQLITVIDRRNKIAHESDMDPTNPGQQSPISRVLVNDALTFLDDVVDAIYSVVV